MIIKHVAHMGKMKSLYKILLGKEHLHKYDNDIKMDL